MAEEDTQDEIRTYSFPQSGYIPGIPGMWPGGSRITINERTREVVEVWPESLRTLREQGASEQTDAPQHQNSDTSDTVQTAQGQGVALPDAGGPWKLGG